jgi:hypothetical protein
MRHPLDGRSVRPVEAIKRLILGVFAAHDPHQCIPHSLKNKKLVCTSPAAAESLRATDPDLIAAAQSLLEGVDLTRC